MGVYIPEVKKKHTAFNLVICFFYTRYHFLCFKTSD